MTMVSLVTTMRLHPFDGRSPVLTAQLYIAYTYVLFYDGSCYSDASTNGEVLL